MRPWLVVGSAQVAAGALLGLLLSVSGPAGLRTAHVLLVASGLALVGLDLGLALAPAFLRREARLAPWAWVSLAPALLAAFAWAPLAATGRDPLRVLMAGHGATLLLGVAGLPLLARSPRWPDGEAIFAPGQPFRWGDLAAATGLATGALGLAASGLLLVAPPRGQPHAALALLLVGGLLPTLLGALLFTSPRHARRPLQGATLLVFALVLLGLAGSSLAYAFAHPLAGGFRMPAAGAIAALVLVLLALARTGTPRTQTHVPPLLRGTAAMAVLAGLALVLSLLGDQAETQFGLLPVAVYAILLLAALLAACVMTMGARLLRLEPPGQGRWTTWAPALAIAGLFLLAPHFQHPRSAFPGALALAVALLVAGRGLWPTLATRE